MIKLISFMTREIRVFTEMTIVSTNAEKNTNLSSGCPPTIGPFQAGQIIAVVLDLTTKTNDKVTAGKTTNKSAHTKTKDKQESAYYTTRLGITHTDNTVTDLSKIVEIVFPLGGGR